MVVHVLKVGVVDVLVLMALIAVRVVVGDVRVLVTGMGVIVDLCAMGMLVAVGCVVLVLRAHAVASLASWWSSVAVWARLRRVRRPGRSRDRCGARPRQ